MSKGEYAKSLFFEGCNCSQAVAVAFEEEIGLPRDLIARLSIGFGGGVGRMREVCGTVCGMTFVLSALYPGDKGSVYARVQEVSDTFRKENGSIVCRELLGLDKNASLSPVPEKRTQEYYKKRPCPELVRMAADILENYIEKNPLKSE